ncbi:protein Loquacious-like isoform X2 [Lycorma delicatula]|uniref:protein Loquacious-like isoform X2 n=1 Tax=Lycorma delicatula TaxID=130591 RepID=UPI003F512396
MANAQTMKLEDGPVAQNQVGSTLHHPSLANNVNTSNTNINSTAHANRRGRIRQANSRPSSQEPIPLEEAAKLELQSLPSKTPVSVLQELLSRRGTTPKYELVQVEGAIHEPTFRYRVTVADVVAMGTGRSKKEAKHTAAKAVLDRLIGINENELNCTSDSLLSNRMMSPYDDKIGGNPIGLVQELCMSRRWPPPSYETEHEEGLPHERQFTIACIVYKYKEVGTGKSKKLAKRQAANKMWLRLKDMPIENNNLHFGLEDDEEISQRMSNINIDYGDLKDTRISTLNPQHSQKVSQFHKNLKSSYGPKLNELQTVILKNLNFNFVQFLQEIATEQQFEVTYVDIEEKSITGKCQCLVQLSTLPVAVCHGSGNNSKEAQSVAAHNALEYLKIMTKK